MKIERKNFLVYSNGSLFFSSDDLTECIEKARFCCFFDKYNHAYVVDEAGREIWSNLGGFNKYYGIDEVGTFKIE